MKKIIYLILCVSLLWACFDDEGNYNYADNVFIEIEGMEENYNLITFQDTLKIIPSINVGWPDDEYTYLWLIYPEGKTSVENTDTIGFGKSLNWFVGIAPGSYTVEFDVFNTSKSDFFGRQTATLTVSTRFTQGFYFLKETGDGNTELDLLLDDDTLLPDLLQETQGAVFPGKPDNMGMFMNYSFINEETGERETQRTLNVITEDNSYILRTTDLTTIYEHDDMFYGEVLDEKVYALRNSYGFNLLTSRGTYYTQGSFFGLPASFGDYPGMGGSAYGFYHSNANTQNFYYYDEITGTFCYVNTLGGFYTCGNMDGHGITHKIKDFGADWQGNTYALFEDESEAGKHYLYAFNTWSAFSVSGITEIPSASLLNQADIVALNKTAGNFYYFVTNNKLYRYYIASNTEELLETQGIGEGEEITFVKERFFYDVYGAGTYRFNYLIVGTSDGADYNVYFYNMVGGAPAGEPVKIVSGKGKVVDVQYVAPAFASYASISAMGAFSLIYNEY